MKPRASDRIDKRTVAALTRALGTAFADEEIPPILAKALLAMETPTLEMLAKHLGHRQRRSLARCSPPMRLPQRRLADQEQPQPRPSDRATPN